MLMLTLQTLVLLTAVLLPLHSAKKLRTPKYNIDRDTSRATYAINENGVLERINVDQPSVKNPRIRN